MSLNEMASEIAAIYKTANSIEVKGLQNINCIVDICNRCEKLVDTLKDISDQIQNEKSSTEEGDVNGGRIESDTESS